MQKGFVSIPFGIKRLADGTEIDYDRLYAEVIRPAVEDEGIECRRLDEIADLGGMWHRTMIAALISSDLVIADVTTDNANVFYELGIRHALSRGRTILISARGRLPGNISYLQALTYEPFAGQLTGDSAYRFRTALQGAIRQAQRSTVPDSPIYQFFPDLAVELPVELEAPGGPPRRSRTREQKSFAQSVIESPAKAKEALERSEAEIRGAPDADASEYLKLMRRYRHLSEWDRVIALGDEAPPDIAKSREVRQLLALALNRRGGDGDVGRAIELMKTEVDETGGDSETFGILGRIYKDRYDQAAAKGDEAKAAENHAKALQYYRQGFEANPGDYYPGVNVVHLLARQGGEAARRELAKLLPRVRNAVQAKLDPDRPDYWALTTDLELATIERDWTRVEEVARQVVSQGAAAWMLETTARNLKRLGEAFSDEGSRRHIASALEIFESAGDETNKR